MDSTRLFYKTLLFFQEHARSGALADHMREIFEPASEFFAFAEEHRMIVSPARLMIDVPGQVEEGFRIQMARIVAIPVGDTRRWIVVGMGVVAHPVSDDNLDWFPLGSLKEDSLVEILDVQHSAFHASDGGSRSILDQQQSLSGFVGVLVRRIVLDEGREEASLTQSGFEAVF